MKQGYLKKKQSQVKLKNSLVIVMVVGNAKKYVKCNPPTPSTTPVLLDIVRCFVTALGSTKMFPGEAIFV